METVTVTTEELQRMIDELQSSIDDECTGQNIAVVFGALLNSLGNVLHHLRQTQPEAFEGACRAIIDLPVRVDAYSQTVARH